MCLKSGFTPKVGVLSFLIEEWQQPGALSLPGELRPETVTRQPSSCSQLSSDKGDGAQSGGVPQKD